MKLIWKIIKYLYSTLLRHIPFALFITATVSIIQSLSTGMITVIMARFFDSVSEVVGAIGSDGDAIIGIPRSIISSALVLTAVSLGREVLSGLSGYLEETLGIRLEGIFKDRLHRECGFVDPIKYEDTYFLDNLEKAKKGIRGLCQFYFSTSMIMTAFLPYLIFMGVFLFRQDPVLAISLLLIFLPVVLNQFLRIKVYKNLEDKAAPMRRLSQHYGDCIGAREYFKETRLLGAYSYFKTLFDKNTKGLVDQERQVEIQVAKWEMMMKLITLSGHIGILILMINSLAKGRITVGSFGAVFASLGSMMGAINQMVYFGFGTITKHLSSVENYVDFIGDIHDCGEEELKDWKGDIILEDVHFRYPNSEVDSIKGVTLDIHPGETLALVGINGSGKTTLVKLITGLYRPLRGRVIWGGAIHI